MEKIGKKQAKEIIQEVLDNKRGWDGYWYENRQNYERGRKFIYEEKGQFLDNEVIDFDNRKKVLLEINRIQPLLRNLVGEYKNTTPSLIVRPADEASKVEQQDIEIIEQLLRTKVNNKEARKAYQECYRNQLLGCGVLGINLDYESQNSIHKTIEIYNLLNPFDAFFDPKIVDSRDLTGQRGDFCGITWAISHNQFKNLYPDEDIPTNFPSETEVGDSYTYNWGDKKIIRLCKYARKEYKSITLAQLSDGRTMPLEDAEKEIKRVKKQIKHFISQQTQMAAFAQIGMQPPAGLAPTNNQIPEELKIELQQVRKIYKIKLYTLTFNKILECEEWPAEKFPWTLVLGNWVYDDMGKIRTKWFGESAKDAQILLNYSHSLNANAMKQAIFAKTVVGQSALGIDEIYKPQMEDSTNTSNVITYDDSAGNIPPPSLLGPQQVSPVYLAAAQHATVDIENCTGMHPATMGADRKELSGVVLGKKIEEAQKTNYSEIDNNYMAIQEIADILVELVPTLYTSTRRVTLTDGMGKPKSVILNEPTGEYDNTGSPLYKNNVKDIKYSVEIDIGAPYAYQKEFIIDSMIKLGAIEDMVSKYIISNELPSKYAPMLAKIYKSQLPPAIKAITEDEPPPPPKPNPMMEIKEKELQLKQQEIIQKSMETNVNRINTQVKAEAEMNKAQQQTVQAHLKTAEVLGGTHIKKIEAENEGLHGILESLIEKDTGEKPGE